MWVQTTRERGHRIIEGATGPPLLHMPRPRDIRTAPYHGNYQGGVSDGDPVSAVRYRRPSRRAFRRVAGPVEDQDQRRLPCLANPRRYPASQPSSERPVRAGTWPPHKAKGTVWVKPRGGTAVEVRVFLSRLPLAPTSELLRIGWHTEILRVQLPSGRHLTVLAGDADVADKQLANLRRLKEAIRAHEAMRTTKSPRVIAFATAGVDGVRHLIDAAVYDPLDRAGTATT